MELLAIGQTFDFTAVDGKHYRVRWEVNEWGQGQYVFSHMGSGEVFESHTFDPYDYPSIYWINLPHAPDGGFYPYHCYTIIQNDGTEEPRIVAGNPVEIYLYPNPNNLYLALPEFAYDGLEHRGYVFEDFDSGITFASFMVEDDYYITLPEGDYRISTSSYDHRVYIYAVDLAGELKDRIEDKATDVGYKIQSIRY